MIKKILKGILNGSIGIDITKIDANKDGKYSAEEIINFLISTGTSVISVLFFL